MEEPLPESKQPVLTNKKSFLTNPTLMGWLAIIGLPLSLLGLYLTFAFNKEARPTYKIISDVVVTSSQTDSKIKVFYDSAQVRNVRTTTIALWNAGNEFLSKDAFSTDKPITIRCTKPVGILNLEAQAVSRPDLKFTAHFFVDSVAGTPLDTTSANTDYVTLEIQGDEGLEAKDGITFSILYTTNANEYVWYVDARIKGIPEGFVRTRNDDFISKMFVYLLAGIIFFIVTYNINSKLAPKKQRWPIIFVYFMVLIMVLFSLYFIIKAYPHSATPPESIVPYNNATVYDE